MKAVFMQICDKKLGSWVCWPMKTTAPASFLYTSSIREGWKTRQHKVCWEDGLACNRDKTSQSIFRHRGRWLEAIKLDYANVFISGHKAKPPYSYSTAKIYIAARLKFTKKCVSHQTTFFTTVHQKQPSCASHFRVSTLNLFLNSLQWSLCFCSVRSESSCLHTVQLVFKKYSVHGLHVPRTA